MQPESETQPATLPMGLVDACERISRYLGSVTRAMRAGDRGPLDALAARLERYADEPCPLEAVWIPDPSDLDRL